MEIDRFVACMVRVPNKKPASALGRMAALYAMLGVVLAGAGHVIRGEAAFFQRRVVEVAKQLLVGGFVFFDRHRHPGRS